MKTNNITSEDLEKYYILYHGTSSDRLENIKSKPTKLFATVDEDAATYYSAKGGEDYFLNKEIEFEKQYGETPDEYFYTSENGELPMFKALYPKDATPIILKLRIPKSKITNINDFIGYKGGELLVEPNEIIDITNVDWNELDY
jgi:hypothetical protein